VPGPGPSARPRHRRPAPDEAFTGPAGPGSGGPGEGFGYGPADAPQGAPDDFGPNGFGHAPPRHGFARPGPYERPDDGPSPSVAAQNGTFQDTASENAAFQDATTFQDATARQGASSAWSFASASETWSSYDEPDSFRTSDEPEDGSRSASEKKLAQLKELYLTAEAIGEENVDKHWDELLQRQRELISGYFKDAGFAVPDKTTP
jgi:hypothetical protein